MEYLRVCVLFVSLNMVVYCLMFVCVSTHRTVVVDKIRIQWLLPSILPANQKELHGKVRLWLYTEKKQQIKTRQKKRKLWRKDFLGRWQNLFPLSFHVSPLSLSPICVCDNI